MIVLLLALFAAMGLAIVPSIAANADSGPTIDSISTSTPTSGATVQVDLVDLEPSTMYTVSQCAAGNPMQPPCAGDTAEMFTTGPTETTKTVYVDVFDSFINVHDENELILCLDAFSELEGGVQCNITVVQHSGMFPHDSEDITFPAP